MSGTEVGARRRPGSRVILVAGGLLLLAALALLFYRAWGPPLRDIWAGSQSGSDLVVTLVFDGGTVSHAYLVPAHQHGNLEMGFPGFPEWITVTSAVAKPRDYDPGSGEEVGVVIGEDGSVTIRQGESMPFDGALEFQWVPPQNE